MNIREEIGKRITKARKELGVTIKELAARTDLGAARIGNWEQGTRSPGPVEAKLLSEQLGVPASWLMCLTDNIKGELKKDAENGMRYIAVIDMDDARDAQKIIDNETFEQVVVVDNFNSSLKSKHVFAVVLKDNSMEPDLFEGNLLVINAERHPKPGDYVLAYLKDSKQTVLRQYSEVEQGVVKLLAHNDLWRSVVVNAKDEMEVLGVATEVRFFL